MQLLEVLAVAHRAGVVCNDVKAEHLFWDQGKKQIKMIDWGNAQFVSDGNAVKQEDVFQCGQLMYYFVTGEEYGKEREEAQYKAKMARLENLVQPGLRVIIRKALRPDPKDRYIDAGELYSALNEYRRGREREMQESITSIQYTAANGKTEEELSQAYEKVRLVEGYNDQRPEIEVLNRNLEARGKKLAEMRSEQLAREDTEKRFAESLRMMSEGNWGGAEEELSTVDEMLLSGDNAKSKKLWDEFIGIVSYEFADFTRKGKDRSIQADGAGSGEEVVGRCRQR